MLARLSHWELRLLFPAPIVDTELNSLQVQDCSPHFFAGFNCGDLEQVKAPTFLTSLLQHQQCTPAHTSSTLGLQPLATGKALFPLGVHLIRPGPVDNLLYEVN